MISLKTRGAGFVTCPRPEQWGTDLAPLAGKENGWVHRSRSHFDDRVGGRGLRPAPRPQHRTCGFPHPAVGPIGVLPARSRGRGASEHSAGLGAFRVRPVVSQSRVVTVVVTPRCFVLSLAI